MRNCQHRRRGREWFQMIMDDNHRTHGNDLEIITAIILRNLSSESLSRILYLFVLAGSNINVSFDNLMRQKRTGLNQLNSTKFLRNALNFHSL